MSIDSPDQTTRVAVLTPHGRGAVATVAVFGPDARSIVEHFFASATGASLAKRKAGNIFYGRWCDRMAGEEVVVTSRNQEHVEIHCHGGNAAPHQIAADLENTGCISANGDQSHRGRSDDRFSLDALQALANARTERTAAILLDQWAGALGDRFNECISAMEKQRPADALDRIDQLLCRASLGLHLTDPWRVVIAGAPNVGKSSLLNALVGFDRSIVVDVPGTTRDVVTATTVIDGWPVLLCDTAGLRDTDQHVEAAGVALANEQLLIANLVLLLFDASLPWQQHDSELVAAWPDAQLVHNKSDLECATHSARPAGCRTSAASGSGIEELLQQISRRLVPLAPQAGDAMPFTHEHVASLQRAKAAIKRGNMPAAIQGLRVILSAIV